MTHSGPKDLKRGLLGERPEDKVQSSERSFTLYWTWLWGCDRMLSGNVTVKLRMVDLKHGKSLSPHWLQWATEPFHNPPLIMQRVIRPHCLSPLKFRLFCYTKVAKVAYLLINQNMLAGQILQISNSDKQEHFICCYYSFAPRKGMISIYLRLNI